MSSTQNKLPIEVGDVFNETDDDERRQVTATRDQADPPIALCVRVVDSDESSEDTAEEYSLQYVVQAVDARKKYCAAGYDKFDAKRIHLMKVKELRFALSCT